MQNLPGTGEEKKTLTVYCNFCHEYQQIFRNRYDESGWANIIFGMTHGAGSPLINIRGASERDEEASSYWLAAIRGPNSKDPNFVPSPRPGQQTKVIITEYELPRLGHFRPRHGGRHQGQVWYSTHRSSYVGRLNPAMGTSRNSAFRCHRRPMHYQALTGSSSIRKAKYRRIGRISGR